MSYPTLASITPDLVARLEEADQRDHKRVVTDFFVELAQKNEMLHQKVEPRFYHALSSAVKSEVIPLFERYEGIRKGILEKQGERSIVRYAGVGAGVCMLGELLLTRGRGLALALPLGIIGAFVGTAIYGLKQVVDNANISLAKQRLLGNIEGLNTRLLVDQEYAKYREGKEGELFQAEAVEVLGQYDLPNAFWRDYLKVRDVDPVCKEDARESQLPPQFTAFYTPHLDGSFSDEARKHRFNQLAFRAYEVFTAKDADYPKKYAREVTRVDR
ncbi:hypothetical protein HYZ97_03890 [Candidatus Pacearchaeota archaeon]|nr:hypothetical protein [Candidatus Pacearchaeota archaeon]